MKMDKTTLDWSTQANATTSISKPYLMELASWCLTSIQLAQIENGLSSNSSLNTFIFLNRV